MRFLSIFFILSIVGLNAFAQNKATPPTDWDAEYTKLCSYDDKFCPYLKHGFLIDGAWVEPTQVSVRALQLHRADILAAANLFGVDPRAVAGSLMADLSLTPMFSSDVKKYLTRRAKGVQPSSLERAPLGIIHTDTAESVEGLAATIDAKNRAKNKDGSPKIRTSQEIYDLLSTPNGTIYYAAAIIRDAVDTYERHNKSIKGRPEIQATLYNLGKVEERAARAEKNNTTPRPNFFGFFVWKNLTIIEGALNAAKETGPLFVRPTLDVCKIEEKNAIAEYLLAMEAAKEAAKKLADLDKKANAIQSQLLTAIPDGAKSSSGKELTDVLDETLSKIMLRPGNESYRASTYGNSGSFSLQICGTSAVPITGLKTVVAEKCRTSSLDNLVDADAESYTRVALESQGGYIRIELDPTKGNSPQDFLTESLSLDCGLILGNAATSQANSASTSSVKEKIITGENIRGGSEVGPAANPGR